MTHDSLTAMWISEPPPSRQALLSAMDAVLNEDRAARDKDRRMQIAGGLAVALLCPALLWCAAHGVTPLVRLLRIQHCPARHDFGLRYLGTDLPAGFAERVAALLGGEDLQRRADATFAWQDELLSELAAG